MTEVSLDDAAGALKVHPRTVLRTLQGNVKAYWAPGYNPPVNAAEIALAYNVELDVLNSVLKGKDELFSLAEASDYLTITYDVKISQFMVRSHKYPVAVKTRGVVRYSRKQISRHYVETMA